ncbi:MAG: cbb3 cytochrome oxidase subunit FixQ protein [Methyloceanibacter sp.]|nr:MAG: cbb3 cytochrome oxidase subunit FixQ protein [Methyloceanibacter sp.]
MIDVSHDTLVGISKSYGLFYLIALSIAVAVYVFWPRNKSKFDRAAKNILNDEDGPWR